ncbi:MAG: hypothetical protein C0432_02545 [Candidatus Puniceispirillum sp.]|nr:hypothetical protein [Candidatus Pelagibacter sp.]MBA4283154.1 hypothetical protein [Candidatus Puniceispirillum sp.]
MTVLNNVNSNINALTARRYMGINQKKLATANNQLASGRTDSDPTDNPSGAALGSLLQTNILTEQQASSNVTQGISLIQLASGSLSQLIENLTTMKSLTAQANTDAVSDSARKMLNQTFQNYITQIDIIADTKWNGVSLFEGNASSATRFGDLAASGATAGQTTTDFENTLDLQGFMLGAVSDISVAQKSANSAEITLKVGTQTFRGTIDYATTGNFHLTSTIDSATSIGLTVSDTGLTSLSNVGTQLKQLFKVDVGTPISLRSESVNLDSISTVSTGTATVPGKYSISYGYDDVVQKITYQLSDGKNVYTQTFDSKTAPETANGTASRTVVFENGLSLVTAGTMNERENSAGYEILDIAGGVSRTMQIQIGADADSMLGINFQATTVALLGLSGASITTKDTAASAADLIDSALNQVNSMIADLGGKKAQLNAQGQALQLQIQNETAAKATFTDVDIAFALQESTQYAALSQMASTVFGSILEDPAKLAALVAKNLN